MRRHEQRPHTPLLRSSPEFVWSNTATGLSDVLEGALSHDPITRFLSGPRFDCKTLRQPDKPMVRAIENDAGVLIFDDTIKEKPYSDENERISRHFDPSKNRAVESISLLNRVHHAQGATLPVAGKPSLPTQRAASFEDSGAATQSESLRRPSLPAETTRGFRPHNGAPDDPASVPRLAAGAPERPSAAPFHRHHPRLRQRSARRLRRPGPCP